MWLLVQSIEMQHATGACNRRAFTYSLDVEESQVLQSDPSQE